MLTHKAIWIAIDALAEKHGLTASGLARKAGLDPTTFNRSKRASRDGKQRWPSTESIAKVVEATGTTMAEFLEVLLGSSGGRGAAFRIPTVEYSLISGKDKLAGLFDAAGLPLRSTPPARHAPPGTSGAAGGPAGGATGSAAGGKAVMPGGASEQAAWDLRPFPGLHDDLGYALDLNTDRFAPLYGQGCILVLSPRAETRRNDRVLAATTAGEILLSKLQRKTLTRIELADLNAPDQERIFDTSEIAWMHRIIWASQ